MAVREHARGRIDVARHICILEVPRKEEPVSSFANVFRLQRRQSQPVAGLLRLDHGFDHALCVKGLRELGDPVPPSRIVRIMS